MSRMRKCLLALAWLTSLPALAQEEVRTIRQELFPDDAGKVLVGLTLGDVTIEGSDGRNVEVEAIFTCKRQDLEACRSRAERIRLAPKMGKAGLRIGLKRTPKGRLSGIKARIRLKIPSRLALEVNVSGGDVFVTGMGSEISVDCASGHVDITALRERTGQVKALVGIGSANLWLVDSRIRGAGFPKRLNWQGPGDASIQVDVGTGDVSVRLE